MRPGVTIIIVGAEIPPDALEIVHQEPPELQTRADKPDPERRWWGKKSEDGRFVTYP